MRKICIAILLINLHLLVFNCSAQYTKLLDFAGALNGAIPYGDLFYDGTYLYGMTSHGGANDYGIIFKIKTDGSGFIKLLDFAGSTNGAQPEGSLIYDGTVLYGMTVLGGTFNRGTIFKIKQDGTGYIKLLNFSGIPNGSTPVGSLITDGTYLYGMTYLGGANNSGVVFKMHPDGSGYGNLKEFAGSPDCSNPQGNLFLNNNYLYGMTVTGGALDSGTIFRIKPDSSSYMKIYDFNGVFNGCQPDGSLIYDGTYLYGMTTGGGTSDSGAVFKIKPDGTNYVKLLDCTGYPYGSNPSGSLITDGTYLYGMTATGGLHNSGTIFKIKPDGSGYAILFDFDSIDGINPYGSLITDGNFLYGMTSAGGANNLGVIFKYGLTTGTNEFSTLNSPFTISPNPFTTTLTISRTEAQGSAAEVSLYDIAGKEILQQKTSSSETTLNTEGIAAGLYFLRVEDGRGVSNYKVVKAQ